MAAEERSFLIDGRPLTLLFERKRVKRINLRVRRDGSLYLSAPPRVSEAVIEQFLKLHLDRISAAVSRQEDRAKASPQLTATDGELLPIEGEAHTLRICKGKSTLTYREGGVLYLFVQRPDDQAARQRALDRYIKEEALRLLGARLALLAPLVLEGQPQLQVKWMRSRWGSCTPSKNLVVLNQRLLFAPPATVDYVIFHELCHYRVADHSPAFYRELSRFCPEHRALRRALAAAPMPALSWRA